MATAHWLGTRTGAGGTATLACRFSWPQPKVRSMDKFLYGIKTFYNHMRNLWRYSCFIPSVFGVTTSCRYQNANKNNSHGILLHLIKVHITANNRSFWLRKKVITHTRKRGRGKFATTRGELHIYFCILATSQQRPDIYYTLMFFFFNLINKSRLTVNSAVEWAISNGFPSSNLDDFISLINNQDFSGVSRDSAISEISFAKLSLYHISPFHLHAILLLIH